LNAAPLDLAQVIADGVDEFHFREASVFRVVLPRRYTRDA
jgi:hypothetical protein